MKVWNEWALFLGDISANLNACCYHFFFFFGCDWTRIGERNLPLERNSCWVLARHRWKHSQSNFSGKTRQRFLICRPKSPCGFLRDFCAQRRESWQSSSLDFQHFMLKPLLWYLFHVSVGILTDAEFISQNTCVGYNFLFSTLHLGVAFSIQL